MGDNKKREINCTKEFPNPQVMRNRTVHHSFSNIQPVSKQHLMASFPPVYVLSMMPYGMEYPTGWVRSAVPAVSPLNFLCLFI